MEKAIILNSNASGYSVPIRTTRYCVVYNYMLIRVKFLQIPRKVLFNKVQRDNSFVLQIFGDNSCRRRFLLRRF